MLDTDLLRIKSGFMTLHALLTVSNILLMALPTILTTANLSTTLMNIHNTLSSLLPKTYLKLVSSLDANLPQQTYYLIITDRYTKPCCAKLFALFKHARAGTNTWTHLPLRPFPPGRSCLSPAPAHRTAKAMERFSSKYPKAAITTSNVGTTLAAAHGPR